MQGKIDGIDPSHCFIYYVHHLDRNLAMAKVLIIDQKMFHELQMDPKIYEISGTYTS